MRIGQVARRTSMKQGPSPNAAGPQARNHSGVTLRSVPEPDQGAKRPLTKYAREYSSRSSQVARQSKCRGASQYANNRVLNAKGTPEVAVYGRSRPPSQIAQVEKGPISATED